MEVTFTARVVEWRGPSPYFYLPVPAEEGGEISAVAALASYGWGVVPVRVRLDGVEFTTSLFPKDGGYLVPVRDHVRTAEDLALDDVLRLRVVVTV